MATASAIAPSTGSPLPAVLLGLLFIPLAGMRRMARVRGFFSRFLSIALLATGLAAMASFMGCGSTNGFFGQSVQGYTVTITATGGTVTHSTTVNLIVQ